MNNDITHTFYPNHIFKILNSFHNHILNCMVQIQFSYIIFFTIHFRFLNHEYTEVKKKRFLKAMEPDQNEPNWIKVWFGSVPKINQFGPVLDFSKPKILIWRIATFYPCIKCKDLQLVVHHVCFSGSERTIYTLRLHSWCLLNYVEVRLLQI